MDKKDDDMGNETLKKELKRKGKIQLAKALESHGGSLSPKDTAIKLNVTTNSLEQLKNDHHIFSVIFEDEEYYPSWQFNQSIQERVQTILKILAPHDDVAKLRFFIIQDNDLGGLTRLKALENPTKEDLDYIHREAKVYNTHSCK